VGEARDADLAERDLTNLQDFGQKDMFGGGPRRGLGAVMQKKERSGVAGWRGGRPFFFFKKEKPEGKD